MPDPPKPTTRLAQIEAPKINATQAKREAAERKLFRPLAIQLGWIVYEWNRLQEWLAQLFADVVNQQIPGIGLSVWYSLTNERAQRDMLREAVKAAASYPQYNFKPRAKDDITWVLGQLEALAGRRNDAIHAPLVFISQSSSAQKGIELIIEPHYFFGNPRAKQLKDKELLGEFEWYRDHLARLGKFAERIHFAMLFDDFPWPDRPQLPPRGRFPNQVRQRRKKKSK